MSETARVGEPVAMALPLAGRRVLVTRAAHQAGVLSGLLRDAGALPVELPVIAFQPPADPTRLDACLTRLDSYDWVVFTSANGVDAATSRLDQLGLGSGELAKASLAAIGSATAACLAEHGLPVAFQPDEFVAEAVLAGLVELGIAGQRVLLLRAERARSILPDDLGAAGAEVDVVPAYRTELPAPDARLDAVIQQFKDDEIDIVMLTSSSTARNLVKLLDGRIDLLNQSRIACIGPITAATATELGLRVDIVAGEYSIPGLVAALGELPSRPSRSRNTFEGGEP